VYVVLVTVVAVIEVVVVLVTVAVVVVVDFVVVLVVVAVVEVIDVVVLVTVAVVEVRVEVHRSHMCGQLVAACSRCTGLLSLHSALGMPSGDPHEGCSITPWQLPVV
jgi:hypothetical protein